MKVRVIQINSLNHTVEIYSKLGLTKDKNQGPYHYSDSPDLMV